MKSLFFFSLCWSVLAGLSHLPAHVILEQPTGGETFTTGNVVAIRWTIEIDHGQNTWDLFWSEDSGATWHTITTGIEKSDTTYNWTVPQVSTSHAQVRVVQNNAMAPDYDDISGNFTINTLSSISAPVYNPKEYTLGPVFPNPFNSSTRITFDLAKRKTVSIVIFDLLGRPVARLLNKSVSPGNYSIRWEADSHRSGIYFLRFSVDGYAETRKLFHIK